MATSNKQPGRSLPPWLSSSPATMPVTAVRPPSSLVTLTLSPSVPLASSSLGENALMVEVYECCRELEEKRAALMAHKKEAAWRLRRVELQLESEKACKRMEKMEETEAKVKALREEQKAVLDRIEAEYREQLAGFRRDAEAKEQKLAEQWNAKHARLTSVLEQMGYQTRCMDPNG